MVRKGMTDELLGRLAFRLGITCLSELQRVSPIETVFAAFVSLEAGAYTADEWKEAMSYIFMLPSPLRPFCQDREIIFWNADDWGGYIADVLKEYFSGRGITGSFHHVSGARGPVLSRGKKYLLFYRLADRESDREARIYGETNQLDLSFAAVCRDYEEGMAAMDHGDTYALQFPLKKERIIHCYEYFTITAQ